jgi:CheY-like chemotaxis protein
MPRVIALVEDLMFLSRIREAARGSGLEVTAVRRADDLAAISDGCLVLVDADSDRLPWGGVLDALREDPVLCALPVVAFVSHVHADRSEQARRKGASRVLARSAFVQELPRLLAAAGHPPSEEKP